MKTLLTKLKVRVSEALAVDASNKDSITSDIHRREVLTLVSSKFEELDPGVHGEAARDLMMNKISNYGVELLSARLAVNGYQIIQRYHIRKRENALQDAYTTLALANPETIFNYAKNTLVKFGCEVLKTGGWLEDPSLCLSTQATVMPEVCETDLEPVSDQPAAVPKQSEQLSPDQ